MLFGDAKKVLTEPVRDKDTKKLYFMKMKTNKKENTTRPSGGFDAIRTMRALRDKMSLEIMNMTYEEEREYLDKLLGQALKSE